MKLKDEFFDVFKIVLDPEKYCCICFKDLQILQKLDLDLSLVDIQKTFFIDDYIPNNLLVKSCCNIHYICIECLRKIVNNYENHPINESNSHIYCPYPFKDCLTKIGFKNIFEHHLIEKICTSNDEWLEYSYHANKYAFPGFTIIKCPMCNTDILIENEAIKNFSIGDLIIKCSQNSKCLKKFCYYCKQYISYYSNSCYDCKTSYENENPNVYNYYINKITQDSPLEQLNNQQLNNQQLNENDTEISSIESYKVKLNYKESSYLYLNKEITLDIVIDQIRNLLNEVSSYMICCICRRSLYKTEKCNGLSHHNLERCYVCGRIGFTVKGLIEHWNSNGVGGCFRFDTDNYIKKTIPEYICNDLVCSNHEVGDCKITEHFEGIYKLQNIRIKSYIYHIIKSLLPELSLKVYDILHEMYKDDDKIYDLLPYKQTLLILHQYKHRYKDFSEEIVYSELKCKNPKEIDDFYIDKSCIVNVDEYITRYKIEYQIEYKIKYSYDEDEDLPLLGTSNTTYETRITHATRTIDMIDTIDITDITDITNTSYTTNENVIDLLNFSLPPIYYTPILDASDVIVNYYDNAVANEVANEDDNIDNDLDNEDL